MIEFLTSNDARFRLARTLLQGFIGVVIANLDLIIGQVVIDVSLRPMITAAVMAVLSPLMAALGEESVKGAKQ